VVLLARFDRSCGPLVRRSPSENPGSFCGCTTSCRNHGGGADGEDRPRSPTTVDGMSAPCEPSFRSTTAGIRADAQSVPKRKRSPAFPAHDADSALLIRLPLARHIAAGDGHHGDGIVYWSPRLRSRPNAGTRRREGSWWTVSMPSMKVARSTSNAGGNRRATDSRRLGRNCDTDATGSLNQQFTITTGYKMVDAGQTVVPSTFPELEGPLERPSGQPAGQGHKTTVPPVKRANQAAPQPVDFRQSSWSWYREIWVSDPTKAS
jgi:hypothetical protein